MKTTVTVITLGCSLLLAVPSARAEKPAVRPGGGPVKLEKREHGLLPPPLVEKLNLSEEQKAKLQEIEKQWAKTRDEYMAAHKAEFDAARAAAAEARKSEDPAKRREARLMMARAMEGLQPQRQAAMEQVKAILSDEQKKILEQARADFQERRSRAKGKGGAAL